MNSKNKTQNKTLELEILIFILDYFLKVQYVF